jgi:iron complex transport system ATP-binding protein
MNAMIRISDLHFSYGHEPILRGISARLEPGTLTGLFGPNGSGKTTLFRCCLKLLQAPHGRIRYRGRDLSKMTPRELSKTAAYVPQDHALPFPFKVQEVVLMGRTPHMGGGLFGIAAPHRRSVLLALEKVGIADLADSRYDQLSGGQRQLVLVARAVAQQTPVLFLDEPTSALDFNNQVRVWQFLRQLAGEGITIVACSHDPNHLLWYCDRVITLNRGRVVADGPPASALGERVLNSVFQERCSVRQVAGVRVVVPRSAEAAAVQIPVSGAEA